MIETALKPAKAIIEGLAWTERYGGLSRPLKISVAGAEGRPVYKVYPIRKALSDEACYRQGRYIDLVPDTKYRNLLYFEQLGALAQTRTENSRTVKLTCRVRLVYWLNLPKMGVAHDGVTDFSDRVSAVLVAALEKRAVVSTPIKLNVEYSNFSILPTTDKIFEPYSYGQDVGALMLYPYDFGAIDFSVTLAYDKHCIDEIVLGEAIDCIEW